MAYATLSQVQGLIPRFTIDANSAPNTAQAQLLVDETEHEINLALSLQGVTIPFVSAGPPVQAAFAGWLALVSQEGSVARILKAMFNAGGKPEDEKAWKFWWDRYSEALKSIKDGTGIPGGIPATGSDAEPATYLTRNPDEEVEDGDIAEPAMRRGDGDPMSNRV